jgi:cytochrome c
VSPNFGLLKATTHLPGRLASDIYLTGTTLNTPENMIRWIVDSKKFDPKSAMPVTGIGEREARDVAAYLNRLR